MSKSVANTLIQIWCRRKDPEYKEGDEYNLEVETVPESSSGCPTCGTEAAYSELNVYKRGYWRPIYTDRYVDFANILAEMLNPLNANMDTEGDLK